MSRSHFSVLVSCILCVICFSLAADIGAQEKPETVKKTRRGPLPFFFGKLGVDKVQRDKLYTIQESYEEKLAALRKEMKALLAQRDAEMEATLTPGQKLRFSELKAAAKKKESQEATTPVKTEPADE